MIKFFLSTFVFFNLISAFNNDLLLINHVKKSIRMAESGVSKLNKQILEIQGMSSAKVRHFLNNICSLPRANYLEIGVYKGSTFVSALYENRLKGIAIDNWSEFDSPNNIFMANVKNFLKPNSYKFFDIDCFKIDKSNFKEKIKIYFFDGNHSADSHKKAFTYYNDIFADSFIAIVDDWNFPDVQKGTREAFKELKYNILFEQILPARTNGDIQQWWNGLYVAVIKK